MPRLLFEDDLSPQEPKLLFEDDLSDSHANNVQQQHPFLYKIAQALQGTPGLDKAANIAGHINRTVEGTGFPNVARGAFGGAINMARGLANLAPGVNIPEAQYPELDVNPIVGQLGETAGSVIGSIPAFKGYQALKGGLGKVPGVNKVPEAIRAILAGGATGSALSSDHRILSGLLGAGAEALPLIPPLTKRGASKSLNKAHKLALQRELGDINVPHELIDDSRQFLPKTLPYRKLMENAHVRDYPSLFNLQSNVGAHARDYAKSIFSAAERAHGREGNAVRQRLLESIRDNLRQEGHGDIADLMQHGQKQFHRYMKFRPYKRAAIITALATTIPGNPLTHLLKKIL